MAIDYKQGDYVTYYDYGLCIIQQTDTNRINVSIVQVLHPAHPDAGDQGSWFVPIECVIPFFLQKEDKVFDLRIDEYYIVSEIVQLPKNADYPEEFEYWAKMRRETSMVVAEICEVHRIANNDRYILQ